MEFWFWFILFLILYCYFGYPVALWIATRVKSWPVQKSKITPAVSVIISVCDEEDVIAEKIQNLLTLDYPAEKIEILIGSDGSLDRTNEIIRGFKDERIRIFENTPRRGKIATVNDLVESHARHPILVFTDARQIFAPDAVKELVANFSDPKVGCVSGELVFGSTSSSTGKGINLYWEYEKLIRRLESRIHSMIGATGAIYSIRRELFTPAPANVVLDDVFVPLNIVKKGFRAIFEEAAHAYDKVAENPQEEYRRKTRTLYGNFQIFSLFPEMFNPFSSPLAVQLFSHKFLRVVVPFLMIALFLLNPLLAGNPYNPFYTKIFVLQILFYSMAVIGGLARESKYVMIRPVVKVCYVPYVFCLLNYSALVGFIKFLTAKQEVTWQKARKA